MKTYHESSASLALEQFTSKVSAGQPCGDSHIPDSATCRVGGGGKQSDTEKSALAHHDAATAHKAGLLSSELLNGGADNLEVQEGVLKKLNVENTPLFKEAASHLSQAVKYRRNTGKTNYVALGNAGRILATAAKKSSAYGK